MNTQSTPQHAPGPEERRRQRARAQAEIARAVGAELRQAREAQGLAVETLASSLKLTASQLHGLEAGEWGAMGAPVYVQGYVRSYGRLLGVDVSRAEQWRHSESVEPPEQSPLSIQNRLPSRALRRSQRVASYLIATALVAVPVVLIVMEAFDGSLFLRGQVAAPERSAEDPEPRAPAAAAPAAEPTPMIASMTPRNTRWDLALPQAAESSAGLFSGSFEAAAGPEPAAAAEAVPPRLRLSLREEVWLEVRNGAGERLAYGLQSAGSELEFSLAAGIDARIGNASAVDATLDGEGFDLAPHMEADVADFSLAADGEPVAPDGG